MEFQEHYLPETIIRAIFDTLRTPSIVQMHRTQSAKLIALKTVGTIWCGNLAFMSKMIRRSP